MINVLTWPLRFALNFTLDRLFGKEEPFEYIQTTPDFFYDNQRSA